MNTATEIGIDMPKCTPEALTHYHGGLGDSIPIAFQEPVLLESLEEGDRDNWKHGARPYFNAGLANVGMELPTLFLPLIQRVMGPNTNANRDDCEAVLLDQVVKSLRVYDPYKGASVVGFVRKSLIWAHQGFQRKQRRRKAVHREYAQSQETGTISARQAEWNRDRTANLSALRKILVGEEPCDRVIVAQCDLTEKQRVAIYLRFYRGLDAIDIAEASGISASGVENRIQRGKKCLMNYCKVHGSDLENLRWKAQRKPTPEIKQCFGDDFLRHCTELLEV